MYNINCFYNSVINTITNQTSNLLELKTKITSKVDIIFSNLTLGFKKLAKVTRINQAPIYLQQVANKINDLKTVLNSKYLNLTKDPVSGLYEIIINNDSKEQKVEQFIKKLLS